MSGNEFDYTPEEREAYTRGYVHGVLDQRYPNEQARAAAFGAIRRVVAEARRIDRGVFYETDANVIDYREAEAAAVRRAIRAAIGSSKA